MEFQNENPVATLPAARHTSPVVPPPVQEDLVKKGEAKTKKKKQKSSKKDKSVPVSVPQKPVSSLTVKHTPGPGDYDDMPEQVFQAIQSSAVAPIPGSHFTGSEEALTGSTDKVKGSSTVTEKPVVSSHGSSTSQAATYTGQGERAPYPPATSMSSAVSGPRHDFQDTGYRDLSLQEVSDNELSVVEDSVADEGEVSSDLIDKQDQTEDMTYRETGRSVRSFMGWNHIPIYESDLSEPDKSNNPWKGKNPKKPARISVAMPPDDWLCQKLEKLNTTVAEGYPSRAQDSAGLKRDQFIKIPKSQSRWYHMHTLKPDGPHRPGKNLFSQSDSGAKLNSQFPMILKASSYPPSGPASRPVSQDYLRRWERCAREGSYVVNSAAGFNRCSSELQDRIATNVSFLSSRLSKGKAPKEV